MGTIIVLLLTFLVYCSNGDTYTFTVDCKDTPSSIWSFWESCTTFDHGYEALREDFQEQLTLVHNELATEWVRFHSIFDDSVGIVNPSNPSWPYSYVNVDKIYDFVTSIDMKPLVEMDFIPSSYAPSNQLSSMYEYPVYVGPPSNHTQWYEFVKSFVEHLVERYGSDTVASWAFDAWYV